MAAIRQKMRVSAVGGTSFTLTPIHEAPGTAGALVDGGVAAGDPRLSSGITTIVVNSAGAPDETFVKVLNQIMTVTLESQTSPR